MNTTEAETTTGTTTIQQLTLAEYMTLPEGAHQLIDGAIVKEPSPSFGHQRVQNRLGTRLTRHVDEHQLGEVLYAPMDVCLSQTDILQPDILFISNKRSHIIGERINGAPDLVVEIISPSTGMYDWQHKRFVYAEHGVAEYWIVDPQEQSVDVMRNQSGMFVPICTARRIGEAWSEVLAGFRVQLNEIFGNG